LRHFIDEIYVISGKKQIFSLFSALYLIDGRIINYMELIFFKASFIAGA